ncbi:MAG: aspartate/glutamate racemase family protein [Pseudomonadota bacterium]
MGERVIVINPNSDRAVTAAMSRNLDSLRFSGGPEICCETLEDAPAGIETARHADQVVGPLCDLIAREDERASAFVIACFGDPGLASARETTQKPVIGICEGGVTVALNHGEHYGILTNMPADIGPGLRQIRGLGLDARLAGIEACGIAVTELNDTQRAQSELTAAAQRLKDRGADVVILGCAGMVPYASGVEQAVEVRTIDPVHAATGIAMTAARSFQAGS